MRRALLVACLALLPAPAAGAQEDLAGVPDEPQLRQGYELYAEHCSRCHGPDGSGVDALAPNRVFGGDTTSGGPSAGAGPSLRGVGERSADFYLRTGRMPLRDLDEQPSRTYHVRFTDEQIEALVAYVGSLGDGPPIPEPEPEEGSLSEGLQLYTRYCAGCHQVVTEGGFATGARVPPLEQASAVEIAEAVRIGPFIMPAFPESTISDEQLNSIIAYVEASQDPEDRGGWGIGHLGPVPEGMVTWFLAATVLVGLCVVIGRRMS